MEEANLRQSREEILETGMMSEEEFTEVLKLLDDPEWVRISAIMISVWGTQAVETVCVIKKNYDRIGS